MGNTAYFHRSMPESPKGRDIDRIADTGSTIVARGGQIESLGERMLRAADTLKMMVDGQVGKGLSLDEVRDQGEEVHADLKKAGERYAPSGTALKAYGQAVAEVAPGLNRAAGDCESLWETVRSRASDVDDAEQTPEGADGGTDARDTATASATSSLSTAKEEWEDAARRFDGYYDTWDAAYDTALTGKWHLGQQNGSPPWTRGSSQRNSTTLRLGTRPNYISSALTASSVSASSARLSSRYRSTRAKRNATPPG